MNRLARKSVASSGGGRSLGSLETGSARSSLAFPLGSPCCVFDAVPGAGSPIVMGRPGSTDADAARAPAPYAPLLTLGNSLLRVATGLSDGRGAARPPSTHTNTIQSARQRLQASHTVVTDGGLCPLGEIADLEGQDADYVKLLTGVVLPTPIAYLRLIDEAGDVLACLASPQNSQTPSLKQRDANGGRAKRAAPAGDDGPVKKRRQPTYFTWE